MKNANKGDTESQDSVFCFYKIHPISIKSKQALQNEVPVCYFATIFTSLPGT